MRWTRIDRWRSDRRQRRMDMINRWRSERKRRRGIVEDLLAQADRHGRLDAQDRELWDEERTARLVRMIRESDDDR